MNIASVARNENGSYSLFLTAGSRRMNAVLVSPLDFRMHLIELPSVRAEHVEGIARIRLRSIYPGCLDNLAIDVSARPKNSVKVDRGDAKTIVCTASNSVVADYRAHKTLIIHPLSILSRYARAFPSGDQIGIFVTEEWREYIRFSAGNPVLEVATTAGTRDVIDEAKALFGIYDLSRTDVFIVRINSTISIAPNTGILHSAKSSLASIHEVNVLSSKSFNLSSLPAIVREIDPSKDGIFYPSRNNSRSLVKIATCALVAINAIAFFATTEIRISAGSHELSELKARYSLYQNKVKAIRKTREQIESIEKSGKNNANTLPGDPYAILSTLADGLINVEIRSLTIDGSDFQLTATAPDAVQILSCIAAKPSFKKVTVQQSSKSEEGKELFTITGEINRVTE